ncbi:transcription elongation factor spt6 [Echinococcus multilocularis]|uniref:Transcription elongation factor spt6 n=1 Tax=Echinococcus multilocularis TaxID=6211 RepID=A0A068Y709_ECHMU|nr:transcription elongation factor spt6 [Echinococcus multilocularis]
MSDYLASEASVSSDEEGPSKPKRLRKEGSVSSEDSEEEEELLDEEEICRKEGQGWIVNDDEDDGGEGSDDGSNASEKSARDDGVDDEDDDVLDDDDYLLIRENVGINVQRKKRRLVLDDEDEADVDVSKASKEARSREAIARQIFEDEDEEAEGQGGDSIRAAPLFAPKSDDEGEESDGMDDFIVDDAAPDGRGARQKRQIVHKDPSLQQAQNIFGVDFDFEDFEQFGGQSSEVSEESDYEDEDNDVGERRRKAKRELKMAPQGRIYELFDPTDLARNFYSPEDERIRCTDIPERFQLRTIPVRRLDPRSMTYKDDLVELEKESEWIYNAAFREGPSKKPSTVTDNIFEVLKLFKESLSEVPFIAFYRKECIQKELNINDLWCIYEYDEKWEILQQRRKGLVRQLKRMSRYLEARAREADEAENNLKLEGLIRLMAMANSATSLEEVQDVRLNYLLHYAGHTQDMTIWEGKDLNIVKMTSRKEDEGSVRRSDDDDEDEDDEEYDPSYGIRRLSVEADKKTVEEDNRQAVKGARKREPGAGVLTTTVDPMTGRRIRQRQVRTTVAYEVAQRAGISGLVERFGLSAEQFADNVHDQYRRHEVNQCPMLPLDAAADFVCPQFSEPATVLRAARYMLAFEISREPVVRQLARMNLSTQAVLDLKPTSKGMRLIDESHPLSPVKFLKNKPIAELMGDVTYLHVHNAVRDGLVTVKVHVPECQQRGLSLLDDLEHYFHQDEFSALVQAWNEQRSLVLKEAIEQFLQPHIFKEMQEKLLDASQQAVVKLCAQKLFKCIKVAPYVMDDHRYGGSGGGGGGGGGAGEADNEDGRSSRHRHGGRYLSDGGESRSANTVWPKPARVLAFALKDDTEAVKAMVTAVRLDADGEVVDFLNLSGLLHSTRSQREEFRKRHDDDVRRLSHFLTRSEPQAIVIGCNSRRSLILRDEVQRLVENLAAESRLSSRPNIELMDTELAEVYARSEAATAVLPSSYPVLLKQAISLGRRLQDPLAEFAQLFNPPDADILGVRWHTVQDEVPREMLLRALEIEFINRTNEVGVDVNRCILNPHTANLLQFVAGLGPRKAFYMIKLLKQKKVFLTNRELLAKVLQLGPHVAINCAGFIKIDTTSARDLLGSEDNIEILDSTRVHPESYDLARQMAVDALEYDDGDDNDPTGALEEIVQSPARLRELDLDAFAEELKRQDHGDKHITLYDIRKELNHRYRDLRDPFEPLTPEQIFSLATHETPETLHKGSLVDCQVVSIATKKPRPEQLDQANPTKNEVTGLWKCPFCRRDDFRQLNEMWSHFDSSDCPGQPVGLRVQLENGISGFIPLRFIDHPVEETLDNISPGAILQAKVSKIDITKFSVELTLRSSDIQNERHMGLSRRDAFFDYAEEEAEQRRQEEEEAKAKARATRAYVNRVIFHPHFKNITYNQLIAMNPTLEVGAIVIRPSRQGTDHLTVSLKVDDGIFKHIDVIEKDKPQSFGLGKTLLIGNESFEDLDEIVARHMEPMVSLIREVYAYKYYCDSQGGKREILAERLRKEKSASHGKIPYFLSSTAEHPGYFILAYMPNQTPRFEMFSVKSEGLRFRHHIFPTLDRMIGWFKNHYNEVRPHYGHHRGSGGGGNGRGAGTLDGISSSRTPKVDDFFGIPIPHSNVVLKPL